MSQRKFLRKSRASGSTRRRVERIIAQGERATRRQFVAAKRRDLTAEWERGTYGQ
jgi:hypothetical protein